MVSFYFNYAETRFTKTTKENMEKKKPRIKTDPELAFTTRKPFRTTIRVSPIQRTGKSEALKLAMQDIQAAGKRVLFTGITN